MNWKLHIELLIASGATPAGIAQEIGSSVSAVREILAGRTKSPRADAALKLLQLEPSQFSDRGKQTQNIKGAA